MLISAARPAPAVASVLTQWALQPVALLVIVGAALWWWRSVGRYNQRHTSPWPRRRTALFAGGLLLFAWVTSGFLQAYERAVFSVYVGQVLVLLLIVPVVLMAGQPLLLAREVYGQRSLLPRIADSRVGRTLSSPFVGPAVVPVFCGLLLFGDVPGWVAQYPAVGWVLAPLVTLVGALIVLPLVTSDYEQTGSLAIGLAMVVGIFELLLDAVPGIAMRLQTHLASGFFDHRLMAAWSADPLRDQQGAGAVLWGVAELLDLPFLVLIFFLWVRADAWDAAQIDTVLEAERISRAELPVTSGMPGVENQPASGTGTSDTPWWLHDPAMRQRMNSQGR